MARPESSVGRFNNSPKWVKAVIGVMSATAILAACSSQPNTEPVSAETSISTTDQGDQNTENQSKIYTPENQKLLDSLPQSIQGELSELSPEAIQFAIDAYAGPDSLAPSLINNKTDINTLNISGVYPQNWPATLLAKLNSGVKEVTQAEVVNFGITPKAIEGYAEQCKQALEQADNNTTGENTDFTTLTPGDSLGGNWNKAKKMHAIAFLETLNRLLAMEKAGEIEFPESPVKNNYEKLESKNITYGGATIDKPIYIEVSNTGQLLVGKEGGFVGDKNTVHLANIENVTPYLISTINGVDAENGAVLLFGQDGVEYKFG